MENFANFIENLGWNEKKNNQRFNHLGETYSFKNEEFEGDYWFYETDKFIIDIHDFLIMKEKIIKPIPNLVQYMLFSSSYIISANGESFNPYQELTANTMFVSNIKNEDYYFLLHANSRYLSVGINFKEKLLNEYIPSSQINVNEMFFDTRTLITEPLKTIASDILNCSMKQIAAEIFFEAKAKEWLSITIDAYINKVEKPEIDKEDEQALENVIKYINDHYALDISQDLLVKIAMMSKTKLKNLFKQKYRMNITEYIQRKRMNIAETLLLTSDLKIKDISKAVGYNSASKFSMYFKKYKGIHPKDLKKPK